MTLKIVSNRPRARFTFPILPATESGETFGITNLRLFSTQYHELSPNDIDRVELEIGGMRWDRTLAEAMGSCTRISSPTSELSILTPNLWALQEGRALPFFTAHSIQIYFDMASSFKGDELILLYDVVTMKNITAEQLQTGIEFPNFQWQYTGIEECYTPEKSGRYTVKCNYNHPIVDFHLRTENPIAEARLILDGHTEIPFTFNEASGIWSIIFTPFNDGAIGDLGTSFNASRVDHLKIEMKPLSDDAPPPGKVVNWTRNFHAGRAMMGMVGLQFSK